MYRVKADGTEKVKGMKPVSFRHKSFVSFFLSSNSFSISLKNYDLDEGGFAYISIKGELLHRFRLPLMDEWIK